MGDAPTEIDSTFREILIAAERAEQLINGAKARIDAKHFKPATIALAELREGRVPWRSVTAEEYEQLLLQKQEALESEEQPPVLLRPTAAVTGAEEVAEIEEEAADEELDEDFDGADFDDDLEDVDEELLEGEDGGEEGGDDGEANGDNEKE
jgi:DNA-directed RNA polymerase subunit K/omega